MFCQGRHLDTLVLPIELTNGNDGQGRQWYRSAKRRDDYQELLSYVIGKRQPYDSRVDVVVCRVLGKRQSQWDPSSILRGNYKQIEDALVALGLFVDDSAKWLRYVIGEQDDSRRDQGPCTEVRIYEIE